MPHARSTKHARATHARATHARATHARATHARATHARTKHAKACKPCKHASMQAQSMHARTKHAAQSMEATTHVGTQQICERRAAEHSLRVIEVEGLQRAAAAAWRGCGAAAAGCRGRGCAAAARRGGGSVTAAARLSGERHRCCLLVVAGTERSNRMSMGSVRTCMCARMPTKTHLWRAPLIHDVARRRSERNAKCVARGNWTQQLRSPRCERHRWCRI